MLLLDYYLHLQLLRESMVYLVGDCLVAAAFLSYSGPFLSDYRDNLVQNQWLKKVVYVTQYFKFFSSDKGIIHSLYS
jgi:hypothetical protein